MYGEKAEEAEELKLDIDDLKTMYRQQVQHYYSTMFCFPSPEMLECTRVGSYCYYVINLRLEYLGCSYSSINFMITL